MNSKLPSPRFVVLALLGGLAAIAASCGGGSGSRSAGEGLPPPAGPEIVLVVPANGSMEGGETVTLVTRNLADDFTVYPPRVFFGAAPGTVTAIDRSSVRVETPACPEGPASITLKTSRQFEVVTRAAAFEFIDPTPRPQVNGLNPPSGMEGGGTLVRIETATFLDDFVNDLPEVTFDGVPSAVSALDSSTLEVETPLHAPGIVDVVVRESNNGNEVVVAGGFQFIDVRGIITHVAPSEGNVQGGNVVRITTVCFNTDFRTNVPGVFFGTERATNVNPVDFRTLDVTAPANAAGTVDVQVVTSNNTEQAFRANAYRYVED